MRRLRVGRASKVICLAVTSAGSLTFMEGFPEFLVGKGWDVHVVSATGPRLSKLGRASGVTTHPIEMSRTPTPWQDLRALYKWIRLLHRIKPDLLLVGTPKASLLAMVAAYLTRVPIRIYHVLGLRLETTTGPMRALLWFLECLTSRAATHLLSVSPSLSRAIVRMRISQPDRVLLLGHGSSNGVDVERYSPNALQTTELSSEISGMLRPDLPVIGFVGRLNPDKGVEHLFAASRILAERNVDHQLLIVGDRDTNSELYLDRTRAIFTGPLADVRPAYARMDVLCLPTLREGLPNVCLEAAAMEVPVVTTTATGAVDSVDHGVTGLTVPPANIWALANALQTLLGAPDTRIQMGKAGRQRVMALFERKDVWARHERLFTRLRNRRLC